MVYAENAVSAKDYLRAHHYGVVVDDSFEQRISFRRGTGDGSWEKKVAASNHWVREELGDCCMQSMANFREGLRRMDKTLDDALQYGMPASCTKCGKGSGGMVSWRKERDLEKDVADAREIFEYGVQHIK